MIFLYRHCSLCYCKVVQASVGISVTIMQPFSVSFFVVLAKHCCKPFHCNSWFVLISLAVNINVKGWTVKGVKLYICHICSV